MFKKNKENIKYKMNYDRTEIAKKLRNMEIIKKQPTHYKTLLISENISWIFRMFLFSMLFIVFVLAMVE